MTKYDDLTTCLLAAGGTQSEDGGMTLTYEEDNELYLKEFAHLADEEPTETTQVAVGIKSGSDAPYLQMGDNRLAFYIDESNVVKYSVYSAEKDDWEESNLAPIDQEEIKVHPQSRLTACLAPAGIMAFFQATDKTIQGLISGQNGWEGMKPIPAKSVEGSALAVVLVDDKPHLFYIHQDKSTHYVIQDPITGTWEDRVLQDSKFDTPIKRMIVSHEEETDNFVAAYLTDDTVYMAGGSDKRREVGKIEGKKLIPSTSAEAILVGVIPVYVDYRGRRNGKMISMSNNYWSTVQPRYNPGRRY